MNNDFKKKKFLKLIGKCKSIDNLVHENKIMNLKYLLKDALNIFFFEKFFLNIKIHKQVDF